MKYVQVTEIYPYSCEGCAHVNVEDGPLTPACLAQTNNKRPDQACGNGIWIEDSPVGHRSHALALITVRLTKE